LSVINGKEIEDYLEKVKEYELAQRTSPNTLAGRAWMKNVVHVTGSSDTYLGTVLCNYMEIYQQIVSDTLFGARVHTFCKTSTNPAEQVSPDKIASCLLKGSVSLLISVTPPLPRWNLILMILTTIVTRENTRCFL
jgi:hypothetical protein